MKRHKSGNKQYLSKCETACAFHALMTGGPVRGALDHGKGLSQAVHDSRNAWWHEHPEGLGKDRQGLHVHVHVGSVRAETGQSSGTVFELAYEPVSRTLWSLCNSL